MARFTGTTYEEFLDWFQGSALENQLKSWYEAKGMEYDGPKSAPYERNEAGRYINEDGEELFYVAGSLTGNAYKGDGYEEYVTLDEVRNTFNDDPFLSKTFGSADEYVAYVQDRQNLIDEGVIMDQYERGSQLWSEQVISMVGSRGGPNADAISNVVGAEMNSRMGGDNDAEAGLREKYGIANSFTDDLGQNYYWNGTGYSQRNVEPDKNNRNIALAIGGALVAPGIGNALGGSLGLSGSGLISSVGNNILGSAVVQGATTGSIDASSLVSAGIAGGLEYLGEAFKAGELFAGSDAAVAFDNALWDMAETLGTDYDTVLGMVEGIASGALQGDDLEEIALGAVADFTTAEVQDWVRTEYGDSLGNIEVDNLFDGDTTTISARSLDGIIENVVGGTIEGGVDTTDWAEALLDLNNYEDPDSVDADGSLGFLDPDLELPDLDSSGLENVFDLPSLGGIEDAVREAGSAVDDAVIQPVREAGAVVDDEVLQPVREMLPHGQTPDWDPDVDIDLPDVDIEGPDVDIEGPDVDLPSVDLPSFDLGSGMMGGGGSKNTHTDFYSGINYRGLDRNANPIIQPTDNQNGALLNELIVRNLGGSLFKG